MSNTIKSFMQLLENSCFCEAKDGGRGYVNKSECKCFNDKEHQCQAYQDREAFHNLHTELSAKDLTRREIMIVAKERFGESKWFQENVTI